MLARAALRRDYRGSIRPRCLSSTVQLEEENSFSVGNGVGVVGVDHLCSGVGDWRRL